MTRGPFGSNRWVVVVLVALVLVVGERRARADGLSALGVAVEGTSMGLLLPPLVGDAVYVAKWQRAPLVWPVASFVCGAGAIALGLAYALPNASSSDDLAGVKVGLGWGLVAEGGAEIGLGVWTLLLPRASAKGESLVPPVAWSVMPVVGRDTTGHPLVGGALTIGRF